MSYEPTQPGNYTTPEYHNPYEHTTPTDPYGMPLSDKLLLRKRAIIESIIDQLKNFSQIGHSRHRSPINFVIHLLAGLLAYSFQDKKLGLHLDEHPLLAA